MNIKRWSKVTADSPIPAIQSFFSTVYVPVLLARSTTYRSLTGTTMSKHGASGAPSRSIA